MDNNHSVYNVNNLQKWFVIRSLSYKHYHNYTMKLHSHKRLEIMYVNFGEMELEYLDGSTPQKMIVHTGEYVFIDAFLPHRITIYDKSTQMLCLELSLAHVSESNNNSIPVTLAAFMENEASFAHFFANQHPIFKLYDDGHLLKYLILVQEYLKNNEQQCPSDSFINFNLGLIFLAVCRTQQAQYSSKTGIIYLKKALAFINEKYNTPITSRCIAQAAGVSQSYLNRLFREDFSLSVNEYLNRLRVERAKRLMEQTDMPLSQIYPIAGIKTKQNFNKHFIRYNGVAPSEYKKSVQTQPTRVLYIDGTDNIHFPDYIYNFVYDSTLSLEE